MKKYFQVLFFIFGLFFIFNNVFAAPLLDLSGSGDPDDMVKELSRNAGIDYSSNNNVGSVMATVIKAFLSLLGLLFIILVILGGYYWMTAGGDETKMTKAKDTLKKAIIGLIIIVSAYAITAFVFKALDDTVGSSFSIE